MEEHSRAAMKAVNYIEEHLDEPLTLDQVANEVGYSKFHLSRLFLDFAGCTPYKYIQGRRLTEAAKKLVYTAKPIMEIAYEAGYNSQQSFTLAFRQLYMCTPQVYRVRRIYQPKQSRFVLKSNGSTRCRPTLKSGVAA